MCTWSLGPLLCSFKLKDLADPGESALAPSSLHISWMSLRREGTGLWGHMVTEDQIYQLAICFKFLLQGTIPGPQAYLVNKSTIKRDN